MTPVVLSVPEPVVPASPSPAPAQAALTAAPIPPTERVAALDTLRGVAVLGILLMNILSFGLPMAAGGNPYVAGGADGPNLAYWFVNQVLFEGKMRCLFSMMFGAGMLILTERAGRAGGETAADVYYRRVIWLIVFGLLHAYLLWYGDILYWYGVIGLILFPLRKVRAGGLLFAGFLLASILVPKALLAHMELEEARVKADEARAAKNESKTLTEEQQAALAAWAARREEALPPRERTEKEIAAHKGTYIEVLKERVKVVEMMQSSAVYRWGLPDVAAMMLIGMGLFKLGVFTAARSPQFYALLALFGYGVGIPLNFWVGLEHLDTGFDPTRDSQIGLATYNYGRLSVALGHVAVVMLICQHGWLGFLTRRLAAVGRMPLSNYFFQTVACVLVFEGYGLGMFGALQRYELLYVVLGVWTAQLVFSPVWLYFFRYGPAEWVWRALTYWQWPPILSPRAGRVEAAPVV